MSSMLPMFAICSSSRIFFRRAFSSGVRFFLAIIITSNVVLLFYTTLEIYTILGMVSLVHFAELKEKRIPELAAHAAFQISTGKLEGFNNKIKVAKRIGYGYRNDEYFFSLIRFLSLPHVRAQSPNFP